MGTTPLIQVAELARALAGPATARPVVLDVRFRMTGPTGRPEFERCHVPGASYVDLDTELATIRNDGVGGRHPMPSAQTFTAAMRTAGVTRSRAVIVYDDWASVPASRLWWMLRHLGFRDVRVLDGGLASWIAAERPTESGPGALGAGDFSPSTPGIGQVLNASEARAYAGRHLLLDGRAADRFRGENETIDPVPGHIPGALNAPTLDNVDTEGRFLPADVLASRFRQLWAGKPAGTSITGRSATGSSPTGATPTGSSPTGSSPAGSSPTGSSPMGATTRQRIGTYCGSGVQATHLALSLCVAGITDDADVYIGSWSDWLTDPTRPVEI